MRWDVGVAKHHNYFANGILVHNSTGEDVTAAVRTIHDVPLRLADGNMTLYDRVELRGEVYMQRSVFNEHNTRREADGEELWANPRNAAVGSLKQQNPIEVAARKLSFIPYEVVLPPGSPADLDAHLLDHMAFAWTNGNPQSLWSQFPMLSVDWTTPSETPLGQRLMWVIAELDVKRRTLDYDTDGAVVKLMNRDARLQLGESSSAPNWAFAFKYPPEEAETTVTSITYQVGRLGTITPVAELQPVHLSGSTISRATLHNFEQLASKDVRAGDTVVISKAGEIIPQVIRVVLEKRPAGTSKVETPTECPCCGSPVKPDVEEAVAVRCTNYDCGEASFSRLVHAVSKTALDVDGMGPSVVGKLVGADKVRNPEDFFTLSLIDLHRVGFGTKQSVKIVRSLEAAKQGDKQAQILYSLSVPGLGKTACKALLTAHRSLDVLMLASDDEIKATPDLLPIAAAAFLGWRNTSGAMQRLNGFRSAGFTFKSVEQVAASTKLEGQVWVITGTLSEEREVFEALIRSHGGKTGSGVTGKTTALLVGDNPGQSKLTKASAKNIRQYSEAECRQLLN